MIKESIKPICVLSGINLFEGGPLSIYYDFIDSIIRNGLDKKYCIIAFVHKTELFEKYKQSQIRFYQLPLSRKNYLMRLYYEYIYFRKISAVNKADIWISLHDITPNVKASKLYTYCHNTIPFFKARLSDYKFSLKIVLFSLFYRFLYRINIKNNTSVIVQSDWMRKKFKELFKIDNIIVARPVIKNQIIPPISQYKNKEGLKTTFFYPAFPRPFKGFEMLCEVAKILETKYKKKNFEFILTINGKENSYSDAVLKKYADLKSLRFVGLLARNAVFDLYQSCDALIFPSRLESWGLPISEFKPTKKPMFLVDLPYAHETLGDYDNVCFFSPDSAEDLANKINDFLEKKNIFKSHIFQLIEEPYAKNWDSLLAKIIP